LELIIGILLKLDGSGPWFEIASKLSQKPKDYFLDLVVEIQDALGIETVE